MSTTVPGSTPETAKRRVMQSTPAASLPQYEEEQQRLGEICATFEHLTRRLEDPSRLLHSRASIRSLLFSSLEPTDKDEKDAVAMKSGNGQAVPLDSSSRVEGLRLARALAAVVGPLSTTIQQLEEVEALEIKGPVASRIETEIETEAQQDGEGGRERLFFTRWSAASPQVSRFFAALLEGLQPWEVETETEGGEAEAEGAEATASKWKELEPSSSSSSSSATRLDLAATPTRTMTTPLSRPPAPAWSSLASVVSGEAAIPPALLAESVFVLTHRTVRLRVERAHALLRQTLTSALAEAREEQQETVPFLGDHKKKGDIDDDDDAIQDVDYHQARVGMLMTQVWLLEECLGLYQSLVTACARLQRSQRALETTQHQAGAGIRRSRPHPAESGVSSSLSTSATCCLPFPIAVAQDVELLHASLLSFFHRLLPTPTAEKPGGGLLLFGSDAGVRTRTATRWSRQLEQHAPLFHSQTVFFPRVRQVKLDDAAPHQLVVTLEQVSHCEGGTPSSSPPSSEVGAARDVLPNEHDHDDVVRERPAVAVLHGLFAARPSAGRRGPHIRALDVSAGRGVGAAVDPKDNQDGPIILSPHVDPRLLLTAAGRQLALLLRAVPQATELTAVSFHHVKGRLGESTTPQPTTVTGHARLTLRSPHFTKDLLRWATRESEQQLPGVHTSNRHHGSTTRMRGSSTSPYHPVAALSIWRPSLPMPLPLSLSLSSSSSSSPVMFSSSPVSASRRTMAMSPAPLRPPSPPASTQPGTLTSSRPLTQTFPRPSSLADIHHSEHHRSEGHVVSLNRPADTSSTVTQEFRHSRPDNLTHVHHQQEQQHPLVQQTIAKMAAVVEESEGILSAGHNNINDDDDGDAVAYMEEEEELILAELEAEGGGGSSAIDRAVAEAAAAMEDGARESAPEHLLLPDEDDGLMDQEGKPRSSRRGRYGGLREEDHIAAKDLLLNEADAETSFVESEVERPRTEAPFTPCCFANGIKLHWISQHSMILQRRSTKQPWGLAIECLESPEDHPELLPMRLVRLPPPRLVKRRGKMVLEQHSFLDFFNSSPRHNWYIDTINGLAARHPDHSIPWMSSLTHMVLKFKRL